MFNEFQFFLCNNFVYILETLYGHLIITLRMLNCLAKNSFSQDVENHVFCTACVYIVDT